MAKYPIDLGRMKARKNSGTEIGKAVRHNFIEGTGVAMTITKDDETDEFDMTIAAHERAHNLGAVGDHPNVLIVSPVTGEVLTYDGVDTNWKNKPPPGGAGMNVGQATIPFASWLNEDKITVTGQAGMLATSKILASIYADNDDIYAQEFFPPVIKNIVAGAGFDIFLRPAIGTYRGNVRVNWAWS